MTGGKLKTSQADAEAIRPACPNVINKSVNAISTIPARSGPGESRLVTTVIRATGRAPSINWRSWLNLLAMEPVSVVQKRENGALTTISLDCTKKEVGPCRTGRQFEAAGSGALCPHAVQRYKSRTYHSMSIERQVVVPRTLPGQYCRECDSRRLQSGVPSDISSVEPGRIVCVFVCPPFEPHHCGECLVRRFERGIETCCSPGNTVKKA